jgi:F0F1-type ATP synthase assembly protein I
MTTSDDGAFWTIIAYLISGLLFWAGLGLLADRIFKTHFLTIVGMGVGMVSGLYLIWVRFVRQTPSDH